MKKLLSITMAYIFIFNLSVSLASAEEIKFIIQPDVSKGKTDNKLTPSPDIPPIFTQLPSAEPTINPPPESTILPAETPNGIAAPSSTFFQQEQTSSPLPTGYIPNSPVPGADDWFESIKDLPTPTQPPQKEPSPSPTPFDQESYDLFVNNINADSQVSGQESNAQPEQDSWVTPEPLESMTQSGMQINSITSLSSDNFSLPSVNFPYSSSNNSHENIELNSGALGYNYNIINLPGRNGLDLVLNLSYSSSNAVMTKNYYDSPKNYYVAPGWRLNIPCITDDQIYMPEGNSYKFIHSSGSVYTIQGKSTADYTLASGAASTMLLTYKNGTVYTLVNGKTTQIKDKFDNEINFEYYTDDDNLPLYNSVYFGFFRATGYREEKLNYIKTITDSLDRQVNFNYTIARGISGTYITGVNITSGTNYTTLDFSQEKGSYGNISHLNKVTNPIGTTSFKYSHLAMNYCYFDGNGDEISDLMAYQIAIDSITYPEGYSSVYEYQGAKRKLTGIGYNAFGEFHKIKSRRDVYGNQEINLKRYFYEGDYSGYPLSSIDDSTGHIYDNAYTYSTVVMGEYVNSLAHVYTFNSKHKLIRQEQTESGGKKYIPSYQALENEDVKTVILSQASADVYTNTINGQKKLMILYGIKESGEVVPEKEFRRPYSIGYNDEIYEVKQYGGMVVVFIRSGTNIYALHYLDWLDQWEAGPSSALSGTGGIYYIGNGIFALGSAVSGGTTTFKAYNASSKQWVSYAFTGAYTSAQIKYADTNMLYCEQGGYIKIFNTSNLTVTATSISTSGTTHYFINNYTLHYIKNNRIYAYNQGTNSSAEKFTLPTGNTKFTIDTYKVYVYYPNGYTQNGASFLPGIYEWVNNQTGEMAYVSNLLLSGDFDFVPGGFFACAAHKGSHNALEIIYPTIQSQAEVNTYSGDLLTKKEYMLYKGGSQPATYFESWEYDAKGNVTKFTDRTGYIATYTYDSAYSMLTEAKYFTGLADKERNTVYTLSTDKKKTEWIKSFYPSEEDGQQNNADIKQYVYGTAARPGNVTVEKIYKGDPLGTVGTELTAVEYEYAEDYKGAYVTQTKVSGIAGKHITGDTSISDSTAAITSKNAYYLSTGKIKETYNGKNEKTFFEYDSVGNLTKTVYPNNTYVLTSYGFKNSGAVVNYVTTNYNGIYQSVNEFDEFGRIKLQKEITPQQQEITLNSFEYGDTFLERDPGEYGKTVTVRSSAGEKTEYVLDSYGDPMYISFMENENQGWWQNHLGSGGLEQVQYGHDRYSMQKSSSITDGAATLSRYNILGQTTSVSKGSSSISYEYDHLGNVTKVTDPMERESVNHYNKKGQLVKAVDAKGQETEYTYDDLGNLKTVTTPGNSVITNSYDKIGRLISQSANGDTVYYEYDAAGNKAAQLKGGKASLYSYKTNTGLIESVTSGQTEESFTYDNMGNMLSMTDASGTTAYEYYYNNRLKKVTSPDSKYMQYEYFHNGNVSQMRDYFGKILNYEYDHRARLEKVTQGDDTLAEYDYTLDGQLKSVLYPEIAKTDNTYYDNDLLATKTNTAIEGN